GRVSRFHQTMTRPFFARDRISHFEIFDRYANHAKVIEDEILNILLAGRDTVVSTFRVILVGNIQY
ncbi:hypothetical protein P692DRAFT_20711511, partial [Suillus brevipes Sb2]